MTTGEVLDRGRAFFEQRAWADAYAQLAAADRASPLAPEDLERLAMAAHLTGRDTDSAEHWARAHHELLSTEHPRQAARCAFWLAFGLLNRGELARGGGWLARAQRLLDEGQYDCAERGYLLLPAVLQRVAAGDYPTAHAISGQAVEIGDRFGDRDLTSLARQMHGRVLIRLGRVAEGVAMLDEAMVAVTASEVSPIVAGTVYCGVIEACQEIFDLRRAREWTAALTHWCDSQPDLVPYNGQCLVHRAEIMLLHGAWPDATEAAERAGERFSRVPGQPALGPAFYQQAELHRLRGDFKLAEEAYRQASQWGREPQPGLAQLRLAQDQVDAAVAAIRRVVDQATDRVTRPKLLAAYVDILLAAQDVAGARGAVDELSEIAAELDAPLLRAMAGHADGAVLLAEGDARAALASLRPAWTVWHELEAPYEAARTRVLMGLACRALGDEDTAQMELDAARWVFQHLGAAPELARVEALRQPAASKPAGGLTAREVQVLRLVAAGKTNRAVAADLVLSEKTVARHVSDILAKLGLPSRSAATAYAYQHDLR